MCVSVSVCVWCSGLVATVGCDEVLTVSSPFSSPLPPHACLQLDSLCAAYDALYKELGPRSGFFLLKHTNDRVLLAPLKDFEQFYEEEAQVL